MWSRPCARRTALATEGELGLPCRLDAIVQQDGNSLTVDARSRLQFDPVQLQLAGTAVTMVPFTWDWLLEVQGLGRDRVAHTLQDWFWQGFDAEDQNALAADGLYGVLHFLGPAASRRRLAQCGRPGLCPGRGAGRAAVAAVRCRGDPGRAGLRSPGPAGGGRCGI
jgi:hypothetical protein